MDNPAERPFETRATTDLHPVSLGLRALTVREASSDRHVLHHLMTWYPHLPPVELLPEPLILDLGAHIGVAALDFLGRFEHARVIAYEPLDSSADLCARTLQAAVNDMKGTGASALVIREAVWSEQTKVSLGGPEPASCRVYETGTDSEPSTPLRHKASATTMTRVIEQALDEHSTRRGLVDYVKMDINGSEGMVFETDHSWLQRIGCINVRVYAPSQLARVGHQLEAAGLLVRTARVRPDMPPTMLHAVSRKLAGSRIRTPGYASVIDAPLPPI